MNLKKRRIILFSITIALFLASPAVAETQIEIDGDTPSFKDEELTSGSVKVSVNYESYSFDDFSDEDNLKYQISYNGTSQINESAFTMLTGSVSLKELDGNKIPEVIIRTYSGGTHCCTNYTIYT